MRRREALKKIPYNDKPQHQLEPKGECRDGTRADPSNAAENCRPGRARG